MYKPLGEITSYEQPAKYLVQSNLYKSSYPTPVLTAGKTFILGHTDETDGIYPASRQPIILFDDFTTANRWVDFDFKVKSSATKLISSKDEGKVLLRYIYHWMQSHPQKDISGEHQRQWISSYSRRLVPIPPLEEQERIVRILDQLDTLTSSLSEGLPKEIELRRKQYTYYREQLLSFPKH